MRDMTNHIKTVGKGSWVVVLALVWTSCGGSSSNQSGTCSGTFNACGGDPTGTWNIADICTENSVASIMNEVYGAKASSCGDIVKSASLTMTGTVTYSSGTITYNTNTVVAGTLSLSSTCISDLAGSTVTVNASVCSALQTSMNSSDGMSGTCSLSGSSCNCSLTESTSDSSSDTYTVSGSTITEDGGDSYDFCVSGNSMSERSDSSTYGYAMLSLTKS
jgi:hypothetical protein